MSFMQHLQSSLILGTKMTHPEEEHFLYIQCKELFIYINANKTTELQNLIESGIDPDKYEREHLPALSYAIKHKKHPIIQTLLSYGSDINHTDCFGLKPLDYAVENKDDAIIELLLRYGAIDTKNKFSHIEQHFNEVDIFEAAFTGSLHALTHYHQLGASLHDLRANKTSLLHLCIDGNNPKLLIYLLNKGVNIDLVDKSGTPPLILATMDSSRHKMLNILIRRNATLDQRNNRQTSALTMAIKRFNVQAAFMLINKGANVNIRDGIDTPLVLIHKALMQTSHKPLVAELRGLQTLLISKGANVNASDENLQWSPLMLTASHYQDDQSIKQLKLLIKLGANLDQRDKNERTAIMIASSLGRLDALEYLIKFNAALNSFDKFGWTALMLAIYYNQKNTVKILLAA
ncbi:MAG: hypothetical protein COA44_11835, partial [Arcobacter sp.]